MAFDIAYKKSVAKDLAGLGQAGARRILDKIEKDLPARAGTYPALKGQFSGLRKLRIGDYRVIYSIDDARRNVDVSAVRHRSEAYR